MAEVFSIGDIQSETSVDTEYQRKRKASKIRPFLRGPIDLEWLTVAASLPGKALVHRAIEGIHKGRMQCD